MLTVDPGLERRTSERNKKRKMELRPAMIERMWKPGQSGNPNGVPSIFHTIVRMCREASPDSIRELIRLRDQSDDDRIRFMCATWLVERGFGKAKNYDPSKEKPATGFNPADYTSEQLAMLEQALAMIRAVRDEKETQEILPPEEP